MAVLLEFYVGSPSMHFKLLKNAKFDIIDFTESKCIEEVKDVDLNYYTKNSEIPQFMAFFSKEIRSFMSRLEILKK